MAEPLPPPPPLPASTAARCKSSRKAISVLLLVLSGLLVVFLGYHGWLTWRVHTRLAEIRASHQPVTLLELNDYYMRVPQASNVALLYWRAFAVITNSTSAKFLETLDELPPGSGPPPPKLRESMARACQENTNALEVLSEAAKLKLCRYPIDYTPGWAALLPHLRYIRQCSALEVSRGLLDEQAGDLDHAIRCIEAIAAFSASLESEPDLVSVLVQHRLDFHASELLKWLLNHRQLSEPQLARLQRVFQANEHSGRLEKALLGERCITLSTFGYSGGHILNLIEPGHEDSLIASFVMGVLRLTGALKKDELRFIDCVESCQRILQLPLPARLDEAEELRATIIREAAPKRFILTGMIFPPFLKAIGKNAESIARHRLVLAALAVEQYRLARNRLPASLDDLSPEYLTEVPKDSFSQGALQYRQERSDYVIYSIGPDRQDDGGTKSISRDQKLDSPKGDIIFGVSRGGGQ